MSERVYTLKISGDVVAMTLQDFSALAGELTAYGVDVEIETGELPAQISFRLKESRPSQ
jgi:hypothetical protein